MKKKALSLALALALCLGLTVPALAEYKLETRNHSGSITLSDLTAEDKAKVHDMDEIVESPIYTVPAGTSMTVQVGGGCFIAKAELGANGAYTHEELTEMDGKTMVWGQEHVGAIWYVGFFTIGSDHFLLKVDDTAPSGQPEQPTDPEPTTPPAETIPASGTAKASTQTVTVDGKAVEFQMYALVDENGNGTNYIKLRDMAYVLNGTKAQFSVGYDNATKSISVTSGQPYEASGAEMTTPYSGDRAYTGGTQTIQVNGEAVEMTAITLLDDAGGGYNYFKLRDLGKALGFNVGWSKEAGVFIESDKPYAE